MTTAQTIAANLNNDGQNFTATDGTHPLAVESGTSRTVGGGSVTWRDGRGTDTYRISFSDGSAIVVAGICWDLAVEGSDDADFCMDGVGHDTQHSGCSTASAQ